MPSIDLLRNDPKAQPFEAGQTIFEAGASGDTMFIVVDGAVELSLHGISLETVESGGFFGEMALIDHRERSASAIGKVSGKIVPIDQKRFLYLISNTPFFAVEVMKVMTDRLRRMNARVEAGNPAH